MDHAPAPLPPPVFVLGLGLPVCPGPAADPPAAASLPAVERHPLLQAAARPDFNTQMLIQAASSALVQILSAGALALGGVALGLAVGACGSLLADKVSNKWAKHSEVKRTV